MAYIGSRPDNVVSRQSSKTYRYTATAGQTVFSGADQDNQILAITPSDAEVHMNGLMLDPTDYTLTGTSVTLSTAATAGDELTVTGRQTFEVADTYSKATADGRYVNSAGDTMTGNLALPTGGFTVGTDQLAVDSAGRVTMPYQPMFTVSQSSTLNYASDAKVAFDGIVTNIGSHFDLANDRFTAPISGKYQFMVQASINGMSSPGLYFAIYFKRNGGGTGFRFRGYPYNSTTTWSGISGTVQFELNANDYIELWAYAHTGYITLQGAETHFMGHLIG